MTNISIQPLCLTHFIEILLVLKFQLTKFIVGAYSYKAHFRPQISSNEFNPNEYITHGSKYILVFSYYNSSLLVSKPNISSNIITSTF